MTLGSPTSPKPGASAQFLPGFLMGDLPAPVTPQPRALTGPSAGVMEMRSPLLTGQNLLMPEKLSCPESKIWFVLLLYVTVVDLNYCRLITCCQ